MKKDNFIDLTETSPPYDDLRDYGGYSINIDKTSNELFRVTKNGGVVVGLFRTSPRMAAKAALRSGRRCLLWKKGFGYLIQ